MKYLFFVWMLMLLAQNAVCQATVYDQPMSDINGIPNQLLHLAGKKIMFVVLPLKEADTAFSAALSRFQELYADSITVVGILSREDGFNASRVHLIKERYASQLRVGMILTEGMNIRKSAGAQQAPVMSWLTKQEFNRHFDRDASGPGVKFFVSGSGRLYAVLGNEVPFDARVIERIVSAAVK